MAIFHKDAPKEAPKTIPKASPKAAGDETVPTQLIPYPTGNPPDPAVVYEENHPERFVDWATTPPASGGTQARKGK